MIGSLAWSVELVVWTVNYSTVSMRKANNETQLSTRTHSPRTAEQVRQQHTNSRDQCACNLTRRRSTSRSSSVQFQLRAVVSSNTLREICAAVHTVCGAFPKCISVVDIIHSFVDYRTIEQRFNTERMHDYLLLSRLHTRHEKEKMHTGVSSVIVGRYHLDSSRLDSVLVCHSCCIDSIRFRSRNAELVESSDHGR